MTNLFFNYTFKGEKYLRGTRIRFAINSLFDQHNIVSVVPFSTKSNAPVAGRRSNAVARTERLGDRDVRLCAEW